MNMETIVISGGTGLIGTALTTLLIKNGYEVILLSRSAGQTADDGNGKPLKLHWDPSRQIIDQRAIERADCIINLAGAGVADKRWTKERKKEIVESRVQSGATLVKALKEIPNKVRTVINSSGVGWYGPDPSVPNPHPFTEDMPAYKDFLGQTCVQWENSIRPVTELGKRLVIFRTGIVLSTKGGALKEFIRPLNFSVASILGSGKQVMSWIHIDDMCRLLMYAIQKNHLAGVYNAVSPHPVTNKELTLALAKTRNRFYIPVPVPSFALKAILGEMSIEVLKSTTVSSARLQAAGFQFSFPVIQKAMADLIRNDD
jgi:uncharacterized protein